MGKCRRLSFQAPIMSPSMCFVVPPLEVLALAAHHGLRDYSVIGGESISREVLPLFAE